MEVQGHNKDFSRRSLDARARSVSGRPLGKPPTVGPLHEDTFVRDDPFEGLEPRRGPHFMQVVPTLLYAGTLALFMLGLEPVEPSLSSACEKPPSAPEHSEKLDEAVGLLGNDRSDGQVVRSSKVEVVACPDGRLLATTAAVNELDSPELTFLVARADGLSEAGQDSGWEDTL